MASEVDETKELESAALAWSDRARAITIRDQQSYDHAAALAIEIVTLERRIQEHHKPIKEAAFAAHRAAVAAERKLLEPLQAAKEIIKSAIRDWDAEQERVRREEQRKAEEEARRRDEEERLQLAVEAETNGATAETVEEILTTPALTVPRPVVPVTFQRAEGVSTQQRWRAEVVDLRQLCRAVAEGRASVNLVCANLTALNAMARAMKGTMNVPGVKAIAESTVAIRSAI
jgi:hypothetical protein